MPKHGARMLSEYPGPTVRVGCGRCMSAKYNRDEPIAVVGDRSLPLLLRQITERKGCLRAGKVVSTIVAGRRSRSCRGCWPIGSLKPHAFPLI